MEVFTDFTWRDGLSLFFLWTAIGIFLIHIVGVGKIAQTLDQFDRMHRRAAILARILVVVFWPVATRIVIKIGEWIITQPHKPLDQIRS